MSPRVAIVGAGAAGIAAALELRARGIEAVVLEARPWTGGRCRTVDLAGVPFDLGASWIHGATAGNPDADIALALDEPVCPDPRPRFVFRNGEPDREGGARLAAAFDAALARLAELAATGRAASLAEVLTGDSFEEVATRTLFADWIAGAPAEEVDVADWMATPSGEDWAVRAGYGRLRERLAARVGVRTRAPVHRIEVLPRGVRLSGPFGSLEVEACVLTVPWPLLLEGPPEILPRLPEPWAEAASGIAMGHATKVCLALDGDPFGLGDSWFAWPEDPAKFDVLFWLRPCGLDLAYGFWGGPRLLEVSEGGEGALIEATLARFADLFGARARARVRAVAVHHWSADPWARGGYTYARPGRRSLRARLREPGFGRLFYAGEASAPGGWHATVGGAHLAGRAAAKAVFDLLTGFTTSL